MVLKIDGENQKGRFQKRSFLIAYSSHFAWEQRFVKYLLLKHVGSCGKVPHAAQS